MKGTIDCSAVFSEDGSRRYSLSRVWSPGKPQSCWVMLNPSIANAERPDPTIKRVMGFARRWGHGGIVVVNLFSLVGTFPVELQRAKDPVGKFDDDAILQCVQGRRVIAAWGNVWEPLAYRIAEVLHLFELTRTNPQCLDVTKLGNPWHPLYVPLTKRPRRFQPIKE